jgi:hypothetical protein
MSPRRRRTAGQELRGLVLTLRFAGVIYLIFASSLYVQIVHAIVTWYVDQLTPLAGAAVPAPS